MSMYAGQTAGLMYGDTLRDKEDRRQMDLARIDAGLKAQAMREQGQIHSAQLGLQAQQQAQEGQEQPAGLPMKAPTPKQPKAVTEGLSDFIRHIKMGNAKRGSEIYNSNGDMRSVPGSEWSDEKTGEVGWTDAETGEQVKLDKDMAETAMYGFKRPPMDETAKESKRVGLDIQKERLKLLEKGKPFKMDSFEKDQALQEFGQDYDITPYSKDNPKGLTAQKKNAIVSGLENGETFGDVAKKLGLQTKQIETPEFTTYKEKIFKETPRLMSEKSMRAEQAALEPLRKASKASLSARQQEIESRKYSALPKESAGMSQEDFIKDFQADTGRAPSESELTKAQSKGYWR